MSVGEAVSVNFRAGGIEEVLNAIGLVDRALVNLGKTTERVGRAGEAATRRRAKTEKDTEDAIGRARQKGAREGEKAAKDYSDYLLKVRMNSLRMAEKLEEQQTKAVQKAANEKKRIADDLERYKQNLERETARMTSRHIEQQITQAENARKRLARSVGSTFGSATRSALGTVGNVASAALAIGGGYSMADAVQTQMRVRGLAKDIELRSASEGGKKRPFTAETLTRIASTAGTQFGFKTEDVLEAANTFVKQSGAGYAVPSLLPQLVELASASGASMGDVGTMAAKFQAQTGNVAQTMDIMRSLIGIGRSGTVDISDLGMYGGRIAAASGKFGDKVGSAKFFTGMMQKAALGGATDAAEASESVMKFVDALTKRRSDIEAVTGKSIFEKNSVMMRDPRSLVLEMLRATGGKQGGTANIFEDVRARKALGGYEEIYRRTFAGAGGKAGDTQGKAAEAAINAVVEAMNADAQAAVSIQEVRAEAAERAAEADRKMTSAMNAFHEAVGGTLLPVVTEKLIPTITKMIPELTKFLDWLIAHPWQGLGALIGAEITKQLAIAGIGGAVRGAIVALLYGGGTAAATTAAGAALGGGGGMGAGAIAGGAAGGGGIVGGLSALGGAVGVSAATAAAAVAAAGAVASTLTYQVVKDVYGASGQRMNQSSLAGINLVNDALRPGPDQAFKARAALAVIEDEMQRARKGSAGNSALDYITGGLGVLEEKAGILTPGSVQEAEHTKWTANQAHMRDLEQAKERLVKALNEASQAQEERNRTLNFSPMSQPNMSGGM